MMERKAKITRTTSETDISVELALESVNDSVIDSGVPFFDHMLKSFAKHGRMELQLRCQGDNEIDDHHSVEDIGITIGSAMKEALGDKSGIIRFGDSIIPMDDALALVAVDLSGRPYFNYDGIDLKGYIGKYSEELTIEFLHSFAMHADVNLHVKVFYGTNRHHIHEAIYKALGIALHNAFKIDSSLQGNVLSTKGTI